METAEVGRTLGASVEPDDDLREIYSVGAMTAKDDLQTKTIDFWRGYYSRDRRGKRGLPAVREAERLIEKACTVTPAQGRVVFVGHGGKLELVTALLIGDLGSTQVLIEFRLGCACFHHIELLIRSGVIVRKCIHCLNA
jgi:hypothetical protein